MDLDELIKAGVMLVFLGIWAVNSIFNREAAKPARGNPRPVAPPPPRPRPAAPPQREPTMRWGPPITTDAGPAPRRASPPSLDDDVLVITAEPPRSKPTPPPTPRPGKSPKRSSRQRSAMGPRQEAPRSDAQSSAQPVDLNTKITQQITLAPLFSTASEARADRGQTRASAPAEAGIDWAARLGTADPLRQAILLNELLQPPLALRRRPR